MELNVCLSEWKLSAWNDRPFPDFSFWSVFSMPAFSMSRRNCIDNPLRPEPRRLTQTGTAESECLPVLHFLETLFPSIAFDNFTIGNGFISRNPLSTDSLNGFFSMLTNSGKLPPFFLPSTSHQLMIAEFLHAETPNSFLDIRQTFDRAFKILTSGLKSSPV